MSNSSNSESLTTITQQILETRGRTNWTYCDFSNCSLQYKDFHGENFSSSHFHYVDLTLVNLTGSNLTDAKLIGSDLTKAKLSDATLTGADLTKAKLAEANLKKAKLIKATLVGANLAGADLTGADLTEAVLTGADLTGANLKNAKLNHAKLTDCNLTNVSNLTFPQVGGADLHNIKPIDAVKIDGTSQIDEAFKNVSKLVPTNISLCFLAILVALSTKQQDIILANGTTKLPILNIDMPTDWFFTLTPLLIASLSLTLLCQLLGAWEAMLVLPAVYPDGRTVQRMINPLLLNYIAIFHWPQLREMRKRRDRVKSFPGVLTIYFLPACSILIICVKYAVKQDDYQVAWQLTLFFATMCLTWLIHLGWICEVKRDDLLPMQRWPTVVGRGFVFFLSVVMPLIIFGVYHQTRCYHVDNSANQFKSEDDISAINGFRNLQGSCVYANLEGLSVPAKPVEWKEPPENDRNDPASKKQWEAFDTQVQKLSSFANLKKASLRHANLELAFLIKSDMSDADLSCSQILNAQLYKSKLSGARMNHANLNGSILTEATLNNAHLIGTNLIDAKLVSADLSGADLTGAYLTGAFLTGADLTSANLKGAHLNDAKIQGAVFSNATILDTDFAGAQYNKWTKWPLIYDPQRSGAIFVQESARNSRTVRTQHR